MPGEKCPLSIFSRCFVASACVSRTESHCARCPCRGDICAVAGRSASYSYLVLKHQALAHRRSSCFCDRRPLLAAGGCDQTHGPGRARVMDGVTSPPAPTGWYSGSPRHLGSLIRHGGSWDAARSLAVAALSAKREEGGRPYPRAKDVCLSLEEGPSEGRHAGAALAGVAPSHVPLLGIAAAARRPPLLPVAESRRGGLPKRGPGAAEMWPEGTRRRPEEAEPDVRGVATVSPGTDISKPFARGGAEPPVGSGGCGGGCPRS